MIAHRSRYAGARRLLFVATALAALCSLGTAQADSGNEFATWENALEGLHDISGDFTVRNIGRSSIAGDDVRVRLSNLYGTQSITIVKATIGLQVNQAQPALFHDSLRKLTFNGGKESVTIGAGESVFSDPVHLRVAARQNVAVSIYAPGAQINDHTFPAPELNPPGSFISGAGDHTSDVEGDSFPSTLVFDNTRVPGWHPGETDLLSDRIAALEPEQQKAIVNAGISGNTVSRQPNPYDPTNQCCGAPAPVRLEHDVLSVPGVTDVLLLEGTNDLGGDGAYPPSPASQVIGGMKEIVQRVHARGLRIVGATVLPMCNAAGSAKEQNRLTVNAFIRTSGIFDGVIDWDAVMKDPTDPTVIRAEWRHDCYHPNAIGDRKMADAVDLRLFGIEEQGSDH